MSDYQYNPRIIRAQRYRPRNSPPPDVHELSAAVAGDGVESQDSKNDLSTHAERDAGIYQSRPARITMEEISADQQLGYFSTSALIINKVVGTGIFVQPATVLALTGSKGASLMLWVFGSLVAWAGVSVYLEYGIRFPLTGGELYYINFVWLKPKLLFTYMYSVMFVVLSGSQANALQFGASVITASTRPGSVPDHRLEKFLAVTITAVICLMQVYSRSIVVRLNNVIAIYKLLLLSLVTILGWCAIGNLRASAAKSYTTSYGRENLRNIFEGTTDQVYGVGIALLVIQRAFLGYENANFVLEEVRRPAGDPPRVFRRTAKVTMIVLSFLYVMVNLAYFTACSTDELLKTSDVPGLFFQKVFGPSDKTRVASAVLIAIAAAGNIMSFTFASVRVKQEIARMGIIPIPEFWASSTSRGTPGQALLLHFLFTSIFVLATPLSDSNGYLVISTLFVYARTWLAILLGLGLLAAPYLKSFAKGGERWRPTSSLRGRWAPWVQIPLTVLYILANAFMLVLYWFPASKQKGLNTSSAILPSYAGPIVGTVFYVAGAIYWFWDLRLLPRLGYRLEVSPERVEANVVYMQFERILSGFAARRYNSLQPYVKYFRRFKRDRGQHVN